MMGFSLPFVDEQSMAMVPIMSDMSTEGVEWLFNQPDLRGRDTTAILPLLIGLTNIFNVEVSSFTTAQHAASQNTVQSMARGILVWISRAVSLMMIPIAMQAPMV
jgi:hypothetical protein